MDTDNPSQQANQKMQGLSPACLQDLQAWKERFILATHSSNDGWWDCDLRTNTVYFSPAWKQMLGYTDDEIPNNFEEWLKRVHADDLESIVKVALQQQREGHQETYEFDHRLQHKDGSYRWIRARGSALYDDSHVVYRIAGWHTDITRRKQEEETQTRQAQHAAFRVDVSVALTERTTLPTILQHCTEAMVHHLHAAFARIWTLTPGEDVLVLQASAGKYTHLNGPHAHIKLGYLKIGRIAQERRPYLTNDVLNDPHISNKEWARVEHMIAFAGYPLIVEDQVVGVMALFSQEPLMEDTLDALASVAHTIAQGIGRKWAEEHLEERVNERTKELTLLIEENAKLSEQAQELAVLQERQRLARELHDSVSQTLYGIALGTRTARTLLHHDAARLVELLDNVHTQAERGLTEMRTLIFELRPEELVNEGLVIALKKQMTLVETRYGLQVVSELGKEPALSLLAKEALYRIAQEALHNIVKHAHVKSAKLQLSEGKTIGGVILEVSDTGVGFDPTQSFPGHLGLQSMRERMARLGGVLEITSRPGHGVQIRATVPYKE